MKAAVTKICFGLLISLLTTANQAQNLNLDWAKSIGGISRDEGYSITTDKLGNVYVTGFFEDSADFDPGTGTFNLYSNGIWDIFIQKLDSTGNFIWAKSIGGTSRDLGASITTDELGNVYVTGFFEDTVDFDPGTGTFILTSNGGRDFFIQKLDASGNFVWAKSIGGSSQRNIAWSITSDASGDLYVTGEFGLIVDFDPSSQTFYLTATGMSSDVFILKLESNGNFVWAKSMGGSSSDGGISITTDASGNFYLTGWYSDTVDFDPDTSTFNLISNGASDVFIQKLDMSGNFVWAKSIGGTLFDAGLSITTDASGNVYLTGYFEDTADFDPGASTFNLTSNGSKDIFIQKLDASGNFIWAKSVGGSAHDWSYSITTDALGNVYVTGNFEETADFDPSIGTFNLTSNGFGDIFILRLDASGNFIWAKSVGGSAHDNGQSITTDALGNLYVTGWYSGVIDFDPGPTTFNLTSIGGSDVFVQKLNQPYLGINENKFLQYPEVFPNPNNGIVNIDLGGVNEVSINVFNVSGQLIHHKENISADFYQFDLIGQPGFYILELSSNGTRRQYKLVKN